MSKISLFFVPFSFFFVATLSALPMDPLSPWSEHSGEHSVGLCSPDNGARVQDTRRRSSLFHRNMEAMESRSDHSFTMEESSSKQPDQELAEDATFETKLEFYEKKIEEAQELFKAALTQLNLNQNTTTRKVFHNDLDSSFKLYFDLPEYNSQNTSRISFCQDDYLKTSTPCEGGSENSHIEDAPQDQSLHLAEPPPLSTSDPNNQSLQESLDKSLMPEEPLQLLNDAKDNILEQTYYYTTTLLEKIASLKSDERLTIAECWEDLVEKTEFLISVLENSKKFSQNNADNANHFSQEEMDLLFYRARLAEYKAEESNACALIAEQEYLTPNYNDSPAQSQERDLLFQGASFVCQMAQVPLNFYEAAEAYNSIHQDENGDDEIAAVYQIMALSCRARAAEATLKLNIAQSHIVRNFPASNKLSNQILKEYDAVINACKSLESRIYSNPDPTDLQEVQRYLAEAKEKKLFFETNKEALNTHYYLIQKRISEDNHLKYIKNLSGSLEKLEDLISQNNKTTFNRFKQDWDQLCTTSSLSIQKGKDRLNEIMSKLISHASEKSIEAKQSLEATPPHLEYHHLATKSKGLSSFIDSSKKASQAYKVALEAANSCYHLLPPESISIPIQQLNSSAIFHQITVDCSHAQDYRNKAATSLALSKELSDKHKLLVLNEASEKIDTAYQLLKKQPAQLDAIECISVDFKKELSDELKLTSQMRSQIKTALKQAERPSCWTKFCSFFDLRKWANVISRFLYRIYSCMSGHYIIVEP